MSTLTNEDISALQKIEDKTYNYVEQIGTLINQLKECDYNTETAEIINKLEQHTYPLFEPEQRVEVVLIGTGEVFPKGITVVSGKIFKSGANANCWKVLLDQAISGMELVEAHSFNIHPIDS